MNKVFLEDEQAFGKELAKVLSPSRPLQSEEFLRGRQTQLHAIKQALFQPGRHVLIHGYRGVGKSSLAQTAAYSIAKGQDPIVIGCDGKSTFTSIVRDVFDEAANQNPTVEKQIREMNAGFERFGISAGDKTAVEFGRPSEPGSVNEAVRLIKFLCESYTPEPVVVIDEFDQITNADEQVHFTNFIKQISDKHVGARFLFCGIGDSVDKIMKAHGSADRYFHTEGLGQLPWEARFEIVTYAAGKLDIKVDNNTVIRAARISDGFPYYVHFLAEKLFWRAFNAHKKSVTDELFELAMSDAAQSMEMRLRQPYEAATQKYSNPGDYEQILWAVADGHELKKRSSDIYDSYNRIAAECGAAPLERDKFNSRMNSLKQAGHGEILTGSRQGWYEFTEKMIRGFVRLKAEQRGIILEADNPAAARRIRT